MLETKSLENYFKWAHENPGAAATGSWDDHNKRHSELLGYFRWADMMRSRES